MDLRDTAGRLQTDAVGERESVGHPKFVLGIQEEIGGTIAAHRISHILDKLTGISILKIRDVAKLHASAETRVEKAVCLVAEYVGAKLQRMAPEGLGK